MYPEPTGNGSYGYHKKGDPGNGRVLIMNLTLMQ